MSSKTAPSSATAKPCRQVTVSLEVIADLQDTLRNVEKVLDEELAVRVGSISCNGKIMGPDDEMAADDLHAVAEVAAARLAVRDAIDELGGIVLSAVETATRPSHPLDAAAADLAFVDRLISEMLASDVVIRIGGRDIRLQLIDPPAGTDPEAEAVERIKKRDGARAKRASK